MHLETQDGKRIPIKDGFVLGRVSGCDLVVPDPKASRRHALLRVSGTLAEVEDLESHNGTLLNGKPVQRRALRDGDEIQIGATVLKFREAIPGAGTGTGTGDGDGNGKRERDGASGARSAVVKEREPDELDLGESPDVLQPHKPLSTPTPPAPESEPAPRVDVVEFADEVVQVRPSEAPTRQARPMPGKPAPATPARQGGVLQFAKQKSGPPVLGDDMRQMSAPMRVVLFVVVLALAVGLGWLAMRLVR